MWVHDHYEFNATNGEMWNIRDELAKREKVNAITIRKGHTSPIENYGDDSEVSFISDGRDYIIVSGLYQNIPTVHQGGNKLRRFIEVIATEEGIVKTVMGEIKEIAKNKRKEREDKIK